MKSSSRHTPAEFDCGCGTDRLRIISRSGRIFIWLIGWLLAVAAFIGCPNIQLEHNDDFLIRVNNRLISVDDFNNAFENIISAYPQSALQKPEIIKSAKLRLLNEMAEELMLLERAESLQIRVSDTEFEAALTKIQQDYPEGVFDQMLLEYAVSYRFWKKRLKSRLLMEKVVARELGELVEISSEEISAHYKTYYEGKDRSVVSDDGPANIDEVIVQHLRREKVEKAYHSWLKKLRDMYTIEINKERWDKILG